MANLNCKASVGCLVQYGDRLTVVYEQQAGVDSWDIPAGGVESDETPEQAIRRELQEEIGLKTTNDVQLASIFWVNLNSIPTVHFLYRLKVDEATASKLKPNMSEIQKIAHFSHDEIQKIIDTKTFEHNLAEARFRFYLNNNNTDTDHPQTINVL